MSIDIDTQNRWVLGEGVQGTAFRMCQSVRVIAGPHEGEIGELISLVAVMPEPLYHLETSNGKDLHVLQSHLAPLDAQPFHRADVFQPLRRLEAAAHVKR
ncbi:hypothetical protein [Piscinibacter sp. XHJ-5]|uniref:hypothetical protein n=1 Tax=Piscinibacter sp. XHJ-5 TaxID=3037797 RepID=UPI002452A9AF|nr:hypothetical protein [Piscinibacter sp. XHJ-5]